MLTTPAHMIIQFSAFNDHDSIRKLLLEANLPLPDQHDEPVRFLVARDQRKVVACIGWEDYKPSALLRSMAVQNDWRNKGIGRLLLQTAIEKLQRDGLNKFYLLTEAVEFAKRMGFVPLERVDLPQSLKQSHQIISDCCATATCMVWKPSDPT